MAWSNKSTGCRASTARGSGTAALPWLCVTARPRARKRAARQRRQRRRGRASGLGARAASGRTTALHGAVRCQRRAHPAPAHRRAPAADGHHASQNGEYGQLLQETIQHFEHEYCCLRAYEYSLLSKFSFPNSTKDHVLIIIPMKTGYQLFLPIHIY